MSPKIRVSARLFSVNNISLEEDSRGQIELNQSFLIKFNNIKNKYIEVQKELEQLIEKNYVQDF